MIDLGEYNLRLCIVQTCDYMVVTFKSIFRGIYYQQDYIVMKLATPKKHEGHTPTNQFIHTLKELNFNRSQKNTQNVLLTPKTSTIQHTPTSRLMAERYINDLFPVSQEKSRSVHQVNTASIKQARNVNKYYQIQFLKPYNEYDRMLTGMPPREYKDAQNQRQSKLVSDLTTKFKKDYTIGKTIGEGPYAEVRVAYHRRTNKKVAIKIYQKAKLNQIGCKKTVKRQIKILQALSHPNIVRLIDVAETNHHLSLIMEYLPGISLAAALKQQTSRIFPQSQCRLIIKQLARALMYLHSLLIAHRDIKLQNIILDQYSQPKLIDFGFSTCIKEGTKVSIFCGTPNYMAPEIIQRREYRGQNADIWALGVIMFTMLVGYFPYQGITDNKLYAKIMKTDYPTKDIKAMQSAHDLISKIFIVNPDKRITAPQILQHPWIKNEQRQENRSQLNSTIKSKRIDEKSKQRSHSKRSQRQCVSERKRQFEIERVKQLSSTQRNLNKKPRLNEKPCKRDKSVESSNSFVLKQNQNCRRQAAQKDKNMKTLTFLKLQFQKCDAQKTPAKSYRF